MKEIFTIGHSSHNIEVFLGLLNRHDVNCIADVRSMPYSKYTSQYNKEGLARILKSNGILYIFLGKELGARQEEQTLDAGDDGEASLPNYQAYEVDAEIVHNLHEDFTYTRPAAFEFKGDRVEVRTWQQMLIKTCEMLMALDRERFISFENDPTMQGRKQKLFSTNPANNRNPHKLKDSELYVETNLSANAMRNLIIKMLQKYSLKTSDFKVFLRADYTNLH